MVLSRNPETGEQIYSEVDAVHKSAALSLYHLEFSTPDGTQSITCTPTHPFYVVGEGDFVMARDLKIGEDFLLADGRTATLARTEREHAKRGSVFDTYNIGVAVSETYFVGESGIWAHNACTPDEQSILGAFRVLLKAGKNNPVDEAFELAKKAPDEAGRAFGALLDDTIDSIDELKAAGKLDDHIYRLGLENNNWTSKSAREAIAGRKMEILTRRTLRRPDIDLGELVDFDFVEEVGGVKVYWDAWGPVPKGGRSQPLSFHRQSILDQFKDGGHAVFDLSGFSPSDQKVLMGWVDEAQETFHQSSNWVSRKVVMLDKRLR